MALKALLCSGDDESPQHRSVLRAIHTLNSPENYSRLFGGLSPIHTLHQRGAQGLMWGTRGPFPPAAVMVSYGCVGRCWQLEANVRSTYSRISRCWETESAHPSPLIPVKSNLCVLPTSLPECCRADLKVSSCSKIHFLLYL